MSKPDLVASTHEHGECKACDEVYRNLISEIEKREQAVDGLQEAVNLLRAGYLDRLKETWAIARIAFLAKYGDNGGEDMSPHHDPTEFPTPTAADYYQQKFQQAVAEMARQRTRAERAEAELAACREQLTEAERWIQAKCTIVGCWKSEYQATRAELERLRAGIKEVLSDGREVGTWMLATRDRLERLLEKPDA